jgi:hypothetical protein
MTLCAGPGRRQLSRLGGVRRNADRFVANASHELRTPVTRQRAMAEVALGDPSPTVESPRTTCIGVLDASIEQERLMRPRSGWPDRSASIWPGLVSLAHWFSARSPADLAAGSTDLPLSVGEPAVSGRRGGWVGVPGPLRARPAGLIVHRPVLAASVAAEARARRARSQAD